MLQTLLEILPNTNGNYYFDNKAEALIYALIGFLIVFVGITLIILVIWLVGLIMKKTNGLAFLNIKRNKNQSTDDKVPVATKGQTQAGSSQDKNSLANQTSNVDDSANISPEIQAAIMAAIMAYYIEQEPTCEFVVKRIKRI